MSDHLVRLHLKQPNLLVVGVVATEAARRASELHGLMPTSAGLFAESLAAGFGVASLLGHGRINLQLSCDGPLKGLLVDADADGKGRGYVKNPSVNFLGAGGAVAAAALGSSGMLSVLRELKAGEFYRGSVALEYLDLARDLERYYLESEQIETCVRLEVSADGSEVLGRVVGLFVQALPDADPSALARVRGALSGQKLSSGPRVTAMGLTRAVSDLFGGDWDLLAEVPLAYECGCSQERVLRAVLAMGREEIADMLAREGKAVATCAFCNTTYEVSAEELERMLTGAAEN